VLEASHRYFHQAADVLNLATDREFWLCFGTASGYGRYVKPLRGARGGTFIGLNVGGRRRLGKHLADPSYSRFVDANPS